jgi:transcriptional regulator with XRE-family HTH domain
VTSAADIEPRDGDGKEDADAELGLRLRRLRTEKRLAAREVAARAGVSAEYLSRLENGRVSPTVATLTRIMRAIGEPVARAFSSVDDGGFLVRRDNRPVLRNRGVEDQLLTPRWATRLEVLETRIAPRAGSGDAYTHPGDEEAIVVLDGSLRVWLNGQEYELGPGDAITFPCTTPHRWLNPGERETRVIWIITPSSY